MCSTEPNPGKIEQHCQAVPFRRGTTNAKPNEFGEDGGEVGLLYFTNQETKRTQCLLQSACREAA